MSIGKNVVMILLILTLCGVGVLRAMDPKNQDILSGKVPAQVLGVIVLHGAGLAASLLLTERNYNPTGLDLKQDQVFQTAESMFQIQTGRDGVYTIFGSYGVGRMYRPWLAGIMQGSLIEFQGRESRACGVSVEGRARLIFLNLEKISIHYDCGLGVCLTDRDFPAGGTKTNFSSSFGLGSMMKIAPGVSWNLGFRHVHISNGGLIAGDERNPGFDSNGIYTGLVLYM